MLTTPLLQNYIANNSKALYPKYAQQKAVGLALVGYFVKGAQSAYRAFFVRIISMHSHFMVRLERDTFTCAGFLLRLSTNPFQLCHPHLVVNGKAPKKCKRSALNMPNQKTILEDHSIDLSDLATQAKGNIAHLAFLFDEVQERIYQLKNHIKNGYSLQLEHFDELDKLMNISIELAHVYEIRFRDLEKEYEGE